MPALFRPEAVEAQQQSWLGGIQLIRPLSLSLLTACAAAAAVAVVGYLCWGEYTRKARVEGVLLPDLGVIRIPPPEVGTVLERHDRRNISHQRKSGWHRYEAQHIHSGYRATRLGAFESEQGIVGTR